MGLVLHCCRLNMPFFIYIIKNKETLSYSWALNMPVLLSYNVVLFITAIAGVPFYGQPKQKQLYKCTAMNSLTKRAMAIGTGMGNLSDMVGSFHKI